MKANDDSSWSLHILKKIEVIWPQYDQKVTSDDLHDHKNQIT